MAFGSHPTLSKLRLQSGDVYAKTGACHFTVDSSAALPLASVATSPGSIPAYANPMNALFSRPSRLNDAMAPRYIKTLAPFAVAAMLLAQGCGLPEPESPSPAKSTGGASSSAPATNTASNEKSPSGNNTANSSTGQGTGETGTTTGGTESSKSNTNSSSSSTPNSSSDQSSNTTTTGTSDASSTTDSSSTDTSSTGDDSNGEKGDGKVELTWIKTGVTAQLISLDARSPSNIWVGGTEGIMMSSRDSGKTWRRVLVSENAADSGLEFRDVEVINMRTIYALAAGKGEASRVFKSRDGGSNWTEQYKGKAESTFINCMDFWDENAGMVFGDASKGKHFMLSTQNGGRNWNRVDASKLPKASNNEGGFSSSGTCTVAISPRTFLAVTASGEKPRLLKTTDRGQTWESFDVPVAGGTSSSGLSSLVMWSDKEGLAFAANLKKNNTQVANAVAYTQDAGKTWEKRNFIAPGRGIYGGAANSDGSLVIAVGPSGMHYSADKGKTWTQISTKNLWSVDFADDKTAFAVGAKGTVVRIKVK